ncbi:MAG: NAD(P)H-dependent glycerol-3-phosphate dehydrogenase [Boseongicola sp.]
MNEIAIFGAGAFGTALALALSSNGTSVTLWCRDPNVAASMQSGRISGPRLPGYPLSANVKVTSEIESVDAAVCLVAVPMQKLRSFLGTAAFSGKTLVACCKGIDLETGRGPIATILDATPDANPAFLTGPSFAVDIARGLPTALTLAAQDDALASTLQSKLSRPALRIYRTTDTIGAELGGALKNVIALASGMAIGVGIGDSARAAVIARGFAEMSRYASAKGALLETLQGLSGLGDLVLTCTSDKSRNFSAGVCYGRGEAPEVMTIEGIATASAVANDASAIGLDMPITQAVAAVIGEKLDVRTAIEGLLSRPVRKE